MIVACWKGRKKKDKNRLIGLEAEELGRGHVM